METFDFSSAKTLVDLVLDLEYFCEQEDGTTPIPFHLVRGKSPLVVVTGDNAGGKSFFRRITQGICAKASKRTECMTISMEGRTGGYMKSLVYGDEGFESTGVCSSNTILKGILTCRERKDHHVIFWDEPDFGLSDSWAAGVGVALREFAESPPAKTVAAFVVSHSKALLSELIPVEPTYIHLGVAPSEAPQSLQEWFEQPIIPRDITTLKQVSRDRFRAIQRILK